MREGLSAGVVIRVAVKSANVDEHYEYYYDGDAQEHERRYGYFATKAAPLAGAQGDAYYSKVAAAKVKHFDRPISRRWRPAPTSSSVWWFLASIRTF